MQPDKEKENNPISTDQTPFLDFVDLDEETVAYDLSWCSFQRKLSAIRTEMFVLEAERMLRLIFTRK